MAYIYIIIAGVLGYFFGIKFGKKHAFGPKTAPELEEMKKESKKALSHRTEKRKAKIVAFAKQAGKITNDEVEDMFCVSDGTANRYLNELEKEGKIKQIGHSGRGVHYISK